MKCIPGVAFLVGTAWFRKDTVSMSGFTLHVATVNAEDKSPMYQGDKDSGCTGCHVGFAHSEQFHNRSLTIKPM